MEKRKIKFRGLDANGIWHFGCGCCCSDGATTPDTIIIQESSIVKLSMVKVRPETIGQFTGEYDQNSVEIYEHDKIECEDHDGEQHLTVVNFDGGAFAVEVYGADYLTTALGWAKNQGDIKNCAVVGNIHQSN